ncbi:hypothetical protein BSZ40_10665 [Buchananella hordeovulneris]|uniref:Uncharacterized protein n=1 Tax=Buchananella hordeovulneris TaxID=52770 RepID=A0A1Q5PTK6_9ACTO|nr:hypothetical protein BSZ40_10665 [Buchananella hordeovulneris]
MLTVRIYGFGTIFSRYILAFSNLIQGDRLHRYVIPVYIHRNVTCQLIQIRLTPFLHLQHLIAQFLEEIDKNTYGLLI